MNWNNIDLNSHEVTSDIIDAYSFETLLLEINCNLRDINAATVRKQFEESLQAKVRSAREVFEANLNNIVKKAQEERAQP